MLGNIKYNDRIYICYGDSIRVEKEEKLTNSPFKTKWKKIKTTLLGTTFAENVQKRILANLIVDGAEDEEDELEEVIFPEEVKHEIEENFWRNFCKETLKTHKKVNVLFIDNKKYIDFEEFNELFDDYVDKNTFKLVIDE